LLAWVERGGVYGVSHIRGGGEYGEDWHNAGRMLTKQNTISDFIACAEYLIQNKYTSSKRLGIRGGSAGGITVGGAITQRPELFAAAADLVPASDMLRMETTPNGPPNVPEFGSTKTEEGFKGLYGMSAYHHIKDGTPFPAVMVTTGINDPRVDSWQAAKMAARLQAATSSGKPILLRIDYDAGHGMGSTKPQNEQLNADMQSFFLWQFGDPEFQPKATGDNQSGNH
jgi:prolyl oligopeptidase